jgi:carbon-monoxide dehydrogenase medium subunit
MEYRQGNAMSKTFEYFRPRTRAEAIALLARPNFHAAPLLILPKPVSPRRIGADAFVDLGLLGLDYIRASEDGSVHIGALATLQEIIDSVDLNRGPYRLLGEAARQVAGPGIRNLAGLAGAILARSGPPEIQLALLVLETELTILGAGEKQRVVPFQEFLETGEKVFHKGEFILEACLPPQKVNCGWALDRLARTSRDEAIVAAASLVEIERTNAKKARLALAGANPLPCRLAALERFLSGRTFNMDIIQEAGEMALQQADPVGGFRGSRQYRRAMAGLVTRRALEKAWTAAVHQEAGR